MSRTRLDGHILRFSLLNMSSASLDFYRELPPFSPFSKVTAAEHYRAVPQDWIVVITDVKGSTKAIEERRYKDVNMLGASSIVAILNALKGRAIPFVFGGDGATLLVHQSDWEKVIEPLQATQAMARRAFNLELRVGAVPMRDLIEQGAQIEVARFQISSVASLAMIRGGGLQLAEKWVKSEDSAGKYSLPRFEREPEASYEGLSCRWNPVQAKRGEMMSLLVLARGDGDLTPTYSRILRDIEAVLNPSGRQAISPIHEDNFAHRANWKGLWTEVKLHLPEAALGPRLLRWLGVFIQVLVVKFSRATGLRLGASHAPTYIQDMLANTDFQKFDDMLRMIREVSREEKDELLKLLEKHRQAGQLYYGTHFSPQALMTCLVFSFDHHIHFVDGGDGGYALAAKQLKAQMKVGP